MVSHNILIFFNMLILTKKGGEGSRQHSGQSLVFQQYLDRTDAGGDARRSLGPPASLPFRHSLKDHALRLQTGPCSLLPINPELRSVRISPQRLWPLPTTWSTYLCRTPSPLALWAAASTATEWLWLAGHLGESAEKHQGASLQRGVPFQNMRCVQSHPACGQPNPCGMGSRRAPGGETLPR